MMQIIFTINCLKNLTLHEINQYIVYNEMLQINKLAGSYIMIFFRKCGGPQAVSLFSFLLSGELLVSLLVCTPADAAVLSVKKENGLRPVLLQVPALHLRAPGCSPEEGRAALRGKSVSPKNGP